jgi:hypothetical protein
MSVATIDADESDVAVILGLIILLVTVSTPTLSLEAFIDDDVVVPFTTTDPPTFTFSPIPTPPAITKAPDVVLSESTVFCNVKVAVGL